MNADTTNTILTIALEAKQMELEQARIQLEDHRSKLVRCVELEEEKTRQLMEEISFIQSQLSNIPPRGTFVPNLRTLYDAACDALEILDPGNPDNYG